MGTLAHLFSCLPNAAVLFSTLRDFRKCSQEVIGPGAQGGSRQSSLNIPFVWSHRGAWEQENSKSIPVVYTNTCNLPLTELHENLMF